MVPFYPVLFGGYRNRWKFRQVERCHPPQLAPIVDIIERRRPVHGCAVVPDHQAAILPTVGVDEPRPGRMLAQFAQHHPRLWQGHVRNFCSMGGQIQGLPAGSRQRADQGNGLIDGDGVAWHEQLGLGLYRADEVRNHQGDFFGWTASHPQSAELPGSGSG
jgi:hypothetical protein